MERKGQRGGKEGRTKERNFRIFRTSFGPPLVGADRWFSGTPDASAGGGEAPLRADLPLVAGGGWKS